MWRKTRPSFFERVGVSHRWDDASGASYTDAKVEGNGNPFTALGSEAVEDVAWTLLKACETVGNPWVYKRVHTR